VAWQPALVAGLTRGRMTEMSIRKLRIAWLAVWLAFSVMAALRTPFYFAPITQRLLVVALFVSIGFVPWINWPRKFTVRTLLIAMTLAAGGLGLVGYCLR
jgi:hypothetical protein